MKGSLTLSLWSKRAGFPGCRCEMSKRDFISRLKGASQTAAMADMAMLLLIFFLVTTVSELPEEAGIELPVAETDGTEPNSYYITLNREGKLYWSNEVVTLSQLQEKLVANAHDNERKVVVNADRDLDYSQVAQILETLKEYDFLNVVFLSEPREP